MNGQLFSSYCTQFGDETDLCDRKKQSRNCVNCPYCKWILRISQPKEEQAQDNSVSS